MSITFDKARSLFAASLLVWPWLLFDSLFPKKFIEPEKSEFRKFLSHPLIHILSAVLLAVGIGIAVWRVEDLGPWTLMLATYLVPGAVTFLALFINESETNLIAKIFGRFTFLIVVAVFYVIPLIAVGTFSWSLVALFL